MKLNRYTPEQLDFLRTGYATMAIWQLTPAFNEQFGETKTKGQIRSTLKNHGITCGRKGGNRISPPSSMYTPERLDFLRKSYASMAIEDLTQAFNVKFITSKTTIQIKAALGNHGITAGRTGRFEKGHSSWNKGTKGKGLTGPNTGSFKKGNAPANRKHLGSERICSKDGFILIKIAERDPYTGFPTRYKHKHIYVWEQTHGPVPAEMCVAFKDGNKLNCEPENLMLISRAELLTMNQLGYKETSEELKPSVLALTKLKVKIFSLLKRDKNE